jgi:hypothetical protein
VSPWVATPEEATRHPRSPDTISPRDDNLDHAKPSLSAPGKGLRPEVCPYAEDTGTQTQWTAGCDDAAAKAGRASNRGITAGRTLTYGNSAA